MNRLRIDWPPRRPPHRLLPRYQELTAARLPFEIVFVSSDEDEASYREHCAAMPWPALPCAGVLGVRRSGSDC